MTVFLRNAAGFFVQFFPCVLMVFLPFPREAYRFQRKYVFIGITATVLALAALFPALMYAAANWNLALSANLFMLATVLLTLAAEIWLVREAGVKKIMTVLAVLFYGASQYWLVNVLNGILAGRLPLSPERESWAVYSPCGLAMYAVTAAALLPLMLLFVIRPMGGYLREVETEEMRKEFLILLVSTAIFLVMIVSADMAYYYTGAGAHVYLQELPLFLALLLDQMLVYWLICRESVRRKWDHDHQRAMEIQQLQYEKIVGDMENTRRMRHDLRHHYSALNEMLRKGQLEQMKDYLAQVLDTASSRMNEVYCGDMAVNGLLQYYAGLARDQGIRCDIQAECDAVAVDSADLTVLFGNAMENAINACRKSAGERWISVCVGTVQGSLAIEISNTCRGVRLARRARTEDGFLPAEVFVSDRADGGYGLRSIAQTAQKYDGSAKFRYNAERQIFTARIRMNMRAQ